MARLALLLALLMCSAAALPAQADAAPKKCKKGFVAKKVKKNGKTVRRCVKKKAPVGTGDENRPVGGGETTTGVGGGAPNAGGEEGSVPPPQPEQVRNDQALLDALTNAAFYKTYSGGGFGSYAYNFLPAVLGESEGRKVHTLRYCTYYYAVGFTTDRSNYNGAWVVKEGYTHPGDPGLVTGILHLWRQGMSESEVVEAPVAVRGANAAIKTGDGSKYFEPGDYASKPGQATTDCSVWEPA